MNHGAWTRAARERTTPSADAVARVRRRLDLQLVPATATLSRLPNPDDAAVRRVRSRLRGQAEGARIGWPVRVVGLGLAGAAMAMTAATAVMTADRAAEPRAERYLTGSGQGVLAEHVIASHDGEGLVQTGPEGVVIDWELGRIDLDVTPDEGVHLTVHTAEGAVRVVGTRLSVERDALGTRVEVAHGEVALTCAGQAEERVGAGGSAACWPTAAAGLLNRARALQDAGAPAERILATVDRGLDVGDDVDDAVRGELLALRAGTLVAAGREREALEAAQAALSAASDPARASSMRRTATRLALRLGDCERARTLAAGLEDSAEERVLAEACLEGR